MMLISRFRYCKFCNYSPALNLYELKTTVLIIVLIIDESNFMSFYIVYTFYYIYIN